MFSSMFVGCAVAFTLADVGNQYRWSLERVLLVAGLAIVATIIEEKIIRNIR